VSALAEAASWMSASKGQKTASLALDAAPAIWWLDTVNMLGFAPEWYVDISDRLELKRRMIRCHRSQVARGVSDDFAPLEALMVAQSKARGEQAGVAAAEAFRSHQAWKRTRAW
jgi:LmbE family N-acetylglucosaminyl deacetylase